MTSPIKTISNFSLHVLFIIIFFLTNGYAEYTGLIPVGDIFLFFIIMSTGSLLIFLVLNRLFRNRLKAGLLTSLIAGFWLFYGALQDLLLSSSIFHNASAHRILIPVFISLLLLLFFWLKKSEKTFRKATLYLNSLLFIFILMDIARISYRMIQKEDNKITDRNISIEKTDCRNCSRPDIYFIVLDEYSGNRVLKEYFHYDNSPFETFLRSNRFFVPANSTSNYAATAVSMASAFEMNFVNWNKQKNELQSYAQAAKSISGSTTVKLLESFGYSFVNYSIFDLGGQPSAFQTGFLPMKLKLITSKTFPERIKRDFFWRVQVRNQNIPNQLKWISGSIEEGNEKMISLTKKISGRSSSQAKFVYTHLMMPHVPYAFDSLGRRNHFNYIDGTVSEAARKSGYVQYLSYTNKRIRDLVETILKLTNRNAVIIILSDHGYRDRNDPTSCEDLNNNFCAVYLPDGNYTKYYDSISNVNQFRVLFNSLFSQQFPLVKDSCVY